MRKFALILTIIGALNLGAIGIIGIDLIGSMFGGTYTIVSRIIYFIIGLAGLFLIPSFMSNERRV